MLVGDRVDFAVVVKPVGDCVVVRVEGELDMASAGTFEEAMNSAPMTQHVILDLSACTFLDSTGMRVIAATVKEAPRVSVVATDPGVLRVLEITAVDTMVSVHPSLEAAL